MSLMCLLCLLHWQVGSLPLALPGKPLFSPPLSKYFKCLSLFFPELGTAAAAAAAKLLQSCPTLCDPIDGGPPGSSVPGILQARTLEWVAISFSNAGKWKWSRSVVSNSSWPHGLQPTRLLHPWDFPGKSTGVGCHCLLQSWGLMIVYCLGIAKLVNRQSPWGLLVPWERCQWAASTATYMSCGSSVQCQCHLGRSFWLVWLLLPTPTPAGCLLGIRTSAATGCQVGHWWSHERHEEEVPLKQAHFRGLCSEGSAWALPRMSKWASKLTQTLNTWCGVTGSVRWRGEWGSAPLPAWVWEKAVQSAHDGGGGQDMNQVLDLGFKKTKSWRTSIRLF